MNISNLLVQDCQIHDCFLPLPKAYQILSKMQNKSPLQVKSVPSVCSRLPPSLGNSAWDLVPFLLPSASDFSLCGFGNPSPVQSAACLTSCHWPAPPEPCLQSPGLSPLLHESRNQLYLLLLGLLWGSAPPSTQSARAPVRCLARRLPKAFLIDFREIPSPLPAPQGLCVT